MCRYARYAGGVPNDPERMPGQEKAARKRGPSRLTGLFLMALALLPFINSINNPRVAMLHGGDILRLIAVGMLLGGGLVIVIIPRDR